MATINLGRIKPVFRGAYSGATAYVIDDIVTSGDETYICIQAHAAGTQAVSVTAYWSKLAAKGGDVTQLTTQGDIVYRDGSGVARLAAGTSGQFLKTQGAGANPVWAGSGLAMQAVHTASTLTAVAGRAYPIDTTSNACTITLPASATAGDELKFIDYAGKWGTNAVTLEPQTLNYQGGSVTQPVYNTNRQSVTIVYVDATQGWIPTVDDDVSYETAVTYNLRYLIVGGGGGGGGDNGGGGGAGGYRTIATKALEVTEATVYTVTVGTGGLGGTNDTAGGSTPNSGEAEGDNGTASSLSGGTITTITSAGGGGGGSSGANGVAGGSGGGGGQGGSAGAGDTPDTTPDQGTAGSNGGSSGSGPGGAGGGATSAGSSVTGGAGTASDITGSSVTYAGGGGGGEDQSSSGNAGAGGAGGGGAGSNSGDGTDGTDALGGGGGGGHQAGDAVGGDGGNGVVILRMLTADAGTPSGHASSAVDGSDTVITWTATGSYTA